MIAFETEVRIERPIEEVYGYVSDPATFPRWNSAVRAVRKSSAGENAVGSTYVMQRQLATGPALNDLEIVARERPSAFAVRTTSGPTPFVYSYRFESANGTTVVRLSAEVELHGAAALLPHLARRAVKSGADDNFRTLKEILESNPAAA